MKNIEELKNEIEGWAAEIGQEAFAIEIIRQFLSSKGDPCITLREIERGGIADYKAIHNNRQQIFRWLRGDSKAAKRKMQVLAPAMYEALPGERQARIAGDPVNYRLSVFLRDVAGVVNAVLLNDRDVVQQAQIAHNSLDDVLDVISLRPIPTATSWCYL